MEPRRSKEGIQAAVGLADPERFAARAADEGAFGPLLGPRLPGPPRARYVRRSRSAAGFSPSSPALGRSCPSPSSRNPSRPAARAPRASFRGLVAGRRSVRGSFVPVNTARRFRIGFGRRSLRGGALASRASRGVPRVGDPPDPS